MTDMTDEEYAESRRLGAELYERLSEVAQGWILDTQAGASSPMLWGLAANLEYATNLVVKQAEKSNDGIGFTPEARAIVHEKVDKALAELARVGKVH